MGAFEQIDACFDLAVVDFSRGAPAMAQLIEQIREPFRGGGARQQTKMQADVPHRPLPRGVISEP